MKTVLKLIFFCFLFSCQSEAAHVRDLQNIAEAVNEKCPIMLDSETRIDGIEVAEPNTLIYKHTLVNFQAEKVDTLEFYKVMWPGIISNIKVSPDMKKLRDNNTSIQYLYRDKAGKHIYTFKIGPKDYNQ